MTWYKPSKENLIPTKNIDASSQVQYMDPEAAHETDPDHKTQYIERYRALAAGSMDRRRFTKLMLASLGAAGLGGVSGCGRKLPEEIVPYVESPENTVPGVPRYYTSVLTRNGYGYGVIVESHEGRPTKIEGNPQHPATLGASDIYMQAELLNLYDPDRSPSIRENKKIRALGNLQSELSNKRQQWLENGGEGLHILRPATTSPSLIAQFDKLTKLYPHAQWHQWQAINDDNALAGARLAFATDISTDYRFREAKIVLQLDGDVLSEFPGSLTYAQDIASRRKADANMSRLYAIESRPSLIGAMADHRLAIRTDRVPYLLEYLMEVLSEGLVPKKSSQSKKSQPSKNNTDRLTNAITNEEKIWLQACAKDLDKYRGRSIVVAGRDQPPEVHAAVHWLNNYLENTGKTVLYRESVIPNPVLMHQSLQDLVEAMQADKVESLLLLDTNPVYDAPADWQFSQLMERIPFRLHLGLYRDESAAHCHWHLPLNHALESWGDAKAFDGSVSIQQPLITPLYDSVSLYSLVAFLNGEGWKDDFECVHEFWAGALLNEETKTSWRTTLIKGVQADSAAPLIRPALISNLLTKYNLPLGNAPQHQVIQDPVLQFSSDHSVWDGRYANNAWLQELPDPFTKLTWGNVLLIDPELAKRYKLQQGDVVQIVTAATSLSIPVYISPEHPQNAVTVHLGYGRKIEQNDQTSAISANIGVNAFILRQSTNLHYRADIRLLKTGEQEKLALTQHHHSMEGRDPVREATLAHFLNQPDFIVNEKSAHPPEDSMYPESMPAPFDHASQYDWAMSIDLNACMGCNACTVACQSENNIPIVGKSEVMAGREMHWIRIDRYYKDDGAELKTFFQPLPCQHCENAPCEYVCPVGATVHDSEGLNVMVYNRCIGTRDCSQNCPYKVRRFNFFDYQYDNPRREALAPAHNPDVTVRSRGVMEKCTYCVQRISEKRRKAKKENRQIQDGEVVTACEQACPTKAITFGNINDPDSAISKARAHPLQYSLLAELNTRPRTTYSARIRNEIDLNDDSGKES